MFVINGLRRWVEAFFLYVMWTLYNMCTGNIWTFIRLGLLARNIEKKKKRKEEFNYYYYYEQYFKNYKNIRYILIYIDEGIDKIIKKEKTKMIDHCKVIFFFYSCLNNNDFLKKKKKKNWKKKGSK